MDSMSRIKDRLPERYAALADTPRVMGEARDSLADLSSATMELEKALLDAGLPKPIWRSEQATLRLLSPALPAITLDAYLTRLEQFAMRAGPPWLHGSHDDLAAFHKEVSVLAQVTRPLREIVQRLQRLPVEMPGGPRSDHPLQRVLRDPHLEPPLDTIAEILSDLEALAPFMRPLTPEQWRALQRPSRLFPARIWTAVTAWTSGLRSRRGAALSPAQATTGAAAKPSVRSRSEPRVDTPAAIVAAEPDTRAACAARRWPPLRRHRRVRRTGPLTPAAHDCPLAYRILLRGAYRPGWIRHSHRARDDLARFLSHICRDTRTSAEADGRL